MIAYGVALPRRRPSARRHGAMGAARRSFGVDARVIVTGAALVMAVTEVVAVFVEAPYAAILAALLMLGAGWLSRRSHSIWPVRFSAFCSCSSCCIWRTTTGTTAPIG